MTATERSNADARRLARWLKGRGFMTIGEICSSYVNAANQKSTANTQRMLGEALLAGWVTPYHYGTEDTKEAGDLRFAHPKTRAKDQWETDIPYTSGALSKALHVSASCIRNWVTTRGLVPLCAGVANRGMVFSGAMVAYWCSLNNKPNHIQCHRFPQFAAPFGYELSQVYSEAQAVRREDAKTRAGRTVGRTLRARHKRTTTTKEPTVEQTTLPTFKPEEESQQPAEGDANRNGGGVGLRGMAAFIKEHVASQDRVPDLERAVRRAEEEAASLSAKLESERADRKAEVEAYDEDYQKLNKKHEAVLAEMKAHAATIHDLKRRCSEDLVAQRKREKVYFAVGMTAILSCVDTLLEVRPAEKALETIKHYIDQYAFGVVRGKAKTLTEVDVKMTFADAPLAMGEVVADLMFPEDGRLVRFLKEEE